MADTIGLEVRVAPTSLRVSADPDFLQSILRNFISNARRYSQKGGLLIGARRDGDAHVRVEVWDTGPGIPEEKREDAFKPFHRLDEARTQNIAGSGLGLTLARDFARAHGGDIRLEDSPMGGLRVRLRLPY